MITAVIAPQNSPGFYVITFSDSNGCLVTVSRTLQSFKELSAKLSVTSCLPSNVEPQFPLHDNPELPDLERYLNGWLNYFTESQNVTNALAGFMEDSPGQSVVTQMQFNALREKVILRGCFMRQFPLLMKYHAHSAYRSYD